MPKFMVEWHGTMNVNGTTIVEAEDKSKAIDMVQENAEMLNTEIQEMGLDHGDIEIDEIKSI